MFKVIYILLIWFVLFDILMTSEPLEIKVLRDNLLGTSVCKPARNCYGTDYCIRLKQNQIKYQDISKSKCFRDKLIFSMGTDIPIFKFDG